MKPKTKIEFAVVDAAKYLPALTEEQVFYAYDKLFTKLCYRTKNTAFCLECGSSLNVSDIARNRIQCTHCNAKLRVLQSLKRKDETHKMYMAIADTWDFQGYKFQIVRNFELQAYYKKGETKKVYSKEVFQKWHADDKTVIYGKTFMMGNHNFCGTMEIRKEKGYYKKYDLNPHIYHPDSEFRPEHIKVGITAKNIGSNNLEYLLYNMKHCPQIETLLKAGYHEVIFDMKVSDILIYWNALKICIRNNYKIKDVTMYKDMLSALKYLGKDLHNAHYVCPSNQKEMHDHWIDIKSDVVNGKEIMDKMKVVRKANPKYIKDKSKFFDLQIKSGNIKIEPLKSVEEFLVEGIELKHCIFRNAYYEEKDQLLLSAKINGKRTETISFSLRDHKVLQSRGHSNKNSKYHDKIVNLVNKNISKIQKLQTVL